MDQTHYHHVIQAMFRATDYGVLMTDTAGTDLLCNPRFGVLFGMDPDKVGRLPREEMRGVALDCVKDQTAFNELMERVDADPLLQHEDDIELKSPRECCLRRHTAPVFDESGLLLGRVWTFLDVTETRRLQAESVLYEKRLEDRLEQQAEDLTAAQSKLLEAAQMHAVGTLAMGVAHDIRNILTTLRLELTALESPGYNALAAPQVDRLYALTHALLALSEESPVGSAMVDLAEIINFVFGLVHGQANIDGVSLEIHLNGATPYVCGNPRRLEHLFINLILNGLNAMAATGGSITVTIGRDAGRIRIDVKDTGPGIPEQDLPHLFEPFFTTRPNRSGLGLFSSRRIVEAHNGEIVISNNEGQGAFVSIWLPASDAGDAHRQFNRTALRYHPTSKQEGAL